MFFIVCSFVIVIVDLIDDRTLGLVSRVMSLCVPYLVEDFKHRHRFGCFACRVVNSVSEYRVKNETQYFEMCVHVQCSVVALQVESSVKSGRIKSYESFCLRLFDQALVLCVHMVVILLSAC